MTNSTTNPSNAGATLTFDDEFTSLSLWNGTTGTWSTSYLFASPTGNGSTLAGNGEQEWYINSNYAPTASVTPWTVNNGILTITAAPAAASIQPLINGYQYTSGEINTSHSFSQTYGYFEMTAKLPAGQGLWPAFWLLPESGAWPPEIDAMEVLGNSPSTLYTSVHSGTASDEVSSALATTVANTSTSFNTYGVDWEPNFITWYFDGQPVYQVATPAALQNIPMYMIANLAAGGYWPGDVNSTTPMPAQMQIEDIRAFAALPSAAYLASEAVTATAGTLDQTAAATYTVPTGIQDVQLIGTAAQTVTANSLGDVITSNDYGSTLIGGTGNDTLIAGHRADLLTGGGGSNVFEFNYLPWNAGQITDFHVGTDTLDLNALLSAADYTGSNAVADGYVSFVSDGSGDTQVYFNSHNPSEPWLTLITTLDHVAPTGLTAANVLGETGSSSPSATVIQTDTNAFGSISLTEVGNRYFLDNSGGSGPMLEAGRTAVVAGQAGTWAPIGAMQTASGYEVAWHEMDVDQYLIWSTDSSGNYVSSPSAMSGSSYALGIYETSFNQDLNGDGVIGPTTTVIQTDTNAFGTVSLTEVGNVYFLDNSSGSGPMLSAGGTAVVAGQAGTWTPIGAALTASGYEIAWHEMGTDQYMVWSTNGSGTYVSQPPDATGSSYALGIYETSFNQDLNGDGVIGPTTTVIQTDTNAFGTVSLTEVGNVYFLDNSSGSGPMLSAGGAAVVAGQAGTWTPIGATLTASGYEIAWHEMGVDQYLIWSTNTSGNYVSSPPAMSGSSYALETSETSFNQDLNGDGVIGLPTTASSSVAIQISAATYTLPGNVQDVQLTGTAAQAVIGNSLGDVITSNDYGSTITGGSGNDTLIAGHGADILTGGGGSDTFVFNYLPWTAGHITDFNVNTDMLDLRGLFTAAGYHGTNPVADGYLSFAADSTGDTKVYFDPNGHGTTIPILITTLDHVAPGSLLATDWIYH